MPTLNWIGKEAVVKHQKEVPVRLLEPVPELSCGDSESGNIIVQGDKSHALKDRSVAAGNVPDGPVLVLLPKFAGLNVIYAAASHMVVRTARAGVSLKHTPCALGV